MPDEERDDESLGLEQLPQSELESVPGSGEQSSDSATQNQNVNQPEANNQLITQDDKNNEVAL